jgi:hypothetical protein
MKRRFLFVVAAALLGMALSGSSVAIDNDPEPPCPPCSR